MVKLQVGYLADCAYAAVSKPLCFDALHVGYGNNEVSDCIPGRLLMAMMNFQVGYLAGWIPDFVFVMRS